jgi:hypothetical protein
MARQSRFRWGLAGVLIGALTVIVPPDVPLPALR